MEINGTSYTIDQLREKMPKYDMFRVDPVTPGSHEDQMDKEPIGTTNPNLHLRHDESEVVKREDPEIHDRKYNMLGLVGTHVYSSRQSFVHDDDIDTDEIP